MVASMLGSFACQTGEAGGGAAQLSAATCTACGGTAASPALGQAGAPAAEGGAGRALTIGGAGAAGTTHASSGGAAGGAAGASAADGTTQAGSGGAAAGAAGNAAADGGARATPTAGGSGTAGANAGSSGTGSAASSCQRSGAADATTPRVYIIGDSTASIYTTDLYPRMGWGQPLQEYFTPACASVQDKALSGRSSKSFYDEGAWTPIRDALRPNDFVLIQFGHNDEKSEDATRYTEPFTTYQSYLSKYIDDAEAKSATPILLTSIERNKWQNGKLSATHGDYPEAMRQLAQTRGLTLVDMTQLTHAYFEHIGAAATEQLFMDLAPGQFPNYPSGNSDDTHLQDKGAHIVAEIALAELARQHTSLAALLKQVPTP